MPIEAHKSFMSAVCPCCTACVGGEGCGGPRCPLCALALAQCAGPKEPPPPARHQRPLPTCRPSAAAWMAQFPEASHAFFLQHISRVVATMDAFLLAETAAADDEACIIGELHVRSNDAPPAAAAVA